MLVKYVFVRELSKKLEILQAENIYDIECKLSKLKTSISFIEYKKWVVDNFILTLPQDGTSKQINGSKSIRSIIDALYSKVLLLNERLNPENLYISEEDTVTLTPTNIPFTINNKWKDNPNLEEDRLSNISEYFQFIEIARNVDHVVEIEKWELLGLSICVRKFVKKQKNRLYVGFTPKTADDIKYFTVIVGIDNFNQLYQYISKEVRYAGYSFETLIDSLYQLVIEKNPFLKVSLKKIQKINDEFILYKSASVIQDSVETLPARDSRVRSKLSKVPKKTIHALEKTLTENIFGQDDAIKALVKSIKRAYIGIKPEHTPIGAFLFYGQTSTGKTELAKILAKALINSPTGLVKIPCNTLTASHTVHTLIGSPPGYVGYEEKGLFNKAFESGSFKVVLFDEIEKATPKLIDLVLEMIEEGKILMADGTVINLSETLFIFTSNIGQAEARKAANTAGFSIDRDAVSDKLKVEESTFKRIAKEQLKPEFLARLNGIFYFRPLNIDNLNKVCELHLLNVVNILAKKKIFIKFRAELPIDIVKTLTNKNKMTHARDIRNYIEVEMLPKLGDFIILNEENITENDEVVINYSANECFSFDIIKHIQKKKK